MIVSIAFLEDEGTGGIPGGAVQVAIWALRNTVSKGYLATSSMAENAKVAMLQLFGLRTGSMLKWFFKTSGVEDDMREGRADVRKVMGTRCEGIR